MYIHTLIANRRTSIVATVKWFNQTFTEGELLKVVDRSQPYNYDNFKLLYILKIISDLLL